MPVAKRLSPDHRGRIAEKVMEWGNLFFAGLVIGQLLPGGSPFNPQIALLGAVVLIIAYSFSVWFMRGGVL